MSAIAADGGHESVLQKAIGRRKFPQATLVFGALEISIWCHLESGKWGQDLRMSDVFHAAMRPMALGRTGGGRLCRWAAVCWSSLPNSLGGLAAFGRAKGNSILRCFDLKRDSHLHSCVLTTIQLCEAFATIMCPSDPRYSLLVSIQVISQRRKS